MKNLKSDMETYEKLVARVKFFKSGFDLRMKVWEFSAQEKKFSSDPTSFDWEKWYLLLTNFYLQPTLARAISDTVRTILMEDIPQQQKVELSRIHKTYSKKKLTLKRLGREDVLQAYRKHIDDFYADLSVLGKIVKTLKPKGSGAPTEKTTEKPPASTPKSPSLEAGGFGVVDMAGIKPKKMEELLSIIEEAARRLKAAKLQKVIYGDVHLTLTLLKAGLLAFYQLDTDKIYVRSNVKNTPETLRTLLHELGHRYESKFLLGNTSSSIALYMKVRDMHHKKTTTTAYPEIGTEFQLKKRRFKVLPQQKRGVVALQLLDGSSEPRFYQIKLAVFYEGTGVQAPGGVLGGGFVSLYAAKNYSENFAEMFAEYALGNLDSTNLKLFQACLDGDLEDDLGLPRGVLMKTRLSSRDRHALAIFLVSRQILADLSPPLGYPGGRCHVVERIETEISNPRARQPLVDRVQDAKELDKNEEKGIYNKDHKEKGPGDGIDYLYISPHAQYKMDLRSVTVPEVRLAVKRFLKSAQKWKEKGDPRFEEIRQRLMRRDSITYVDTQTKLKIVFVPDGAKALKIVTTFWEGYPDPPKFNGECEV